LKKNVGRGNVNRYRLPTLEVLLERNGATTDTNTNEGVAQEMVPSVAEKVPDLTEMVPSVVINGARSGTQNLVGNQVMDQVPGNVKGEPVSETSAEDQPMPELTRAELQAVKAPARQPRNLPDTPWTRLTRYAFETWPPQAEPMQNARAVLPPELKRILERCDGDDAEAIAAIKAFAAAQGGDRPRYPFVLAHLGKWRTAGKPETFDPFNQPRTPPKEASVAQRLFASSGALGPLRTEADTQREWGADIAIAAEQRKKRESFLRMRNGTRDPA
jgi:hypothetical protein